MKIKKIFPSKLIKGDEVRVISPSRSMEIISPSVRSVAQKRLEALGLCVSFAKNSCERDEFDSSSIESRLEDIHEAFADKNVKGILTTIGGFNSIQLLRQLDYQLIRKSPKIFCGYSDITILQNAIFAKTGLVTYSGPHFSTFGCLKSVEYFVDYFRKCLFTMDHELPLVPSAEWSDDEWYLDQENRVFLSNSGYVVLQQGKAFGTLLGGNIDSFSALQGTEFMPSLKGVVLFLEDNYPMTIDVLDRHLHSLSLQDDFQHVRGIVLGRFQIDSRICADHLKKIFASNDKLKKIPVVSGADFGHTLPMFTFPIGGEVKIEANSYLKEIVLTKF